jgi:two-component system sensor kinase FixL
MPTAHRVLSAILAAADCAMVQTDLSGTILSWNPGAERLIGFAAGEVVGQSIACIIPADRRGELDDLMRRIGAGQSTDPFETEIRGKVRDAVAVTMAVASVTDPEGRPAGAVWTARDRMDAEQANAALRRSDARWQAIVESAVDAIILIDRRGVIESFNASAERMFGYRAGEVIGRNVTVLMPEPYASEHDQYMGRYLRTRERRIIGIGREVTARRKDGTTFPAHLSVGECHLNDEAKFTGIIRDLTERVSLEVRLREESGLVRIGELAAVLAHEVKNPLAAVSGAVQMLGDHLTSDEDREIVGEILRRLDGLGTLMTDLLLYARPPRPSPIDVDVGGLLRALVAFFQSDPAWHRLAVTIDGTDVRLAADPELLKVALQNLLLNAAQAMKGQGEVRVTVTAADGLVHLDVVDQGPGIPPDVREKLFTPFFTTKSRGTGLGLATVRRIAEAHRGQVTILESGRAGTTMRLTLPVSSHGPNWRSS